MLLAKALCQLQIAFFMLLFCCFVLPLFIMDYRNKRTKEQNNIFTKDKSCP